MGDCHLEVPYDTVAERVDPAVDAKLLAARPGLLDENVGGDVPHLADDVQLAESVEAGAPVRDRFEFRAMLLPDLADRVQPVIDQAAPLDRPPRRSRRRSRNARPP